MNKLISIPVFLLFLFVPWFKGGKELAPLTIIQFMVIAAAFLCLLKNKQFPFNRSSRMNFPLAVLVFFCLLSVIASTYVYNSLIGFISILVFIILYQVLVYNSSDSMNEKLLNMVFVLTFIC